MLSCRLSTIRNIQGFSMIPECSTAELLDASHLIVESLTPITPFADHLGENDIHFREV